MSVVVALDEDGGGESQTVAEKRRKQIVDAAVRLFSERGYFQTTIEDIANAVPVSKGLVYRYFKDKNDLLFFSLRYVLDMYHADHIQRVLDSAGPLVALNEVLAVHCTYSREHPSEVALAYKSTKDLMPEQKLEIKILESKMARVIRQCLESCIRNGLMIEVNADIMAYQFIMFGHTWALKNWAFRDRYAADEYMAEGEKILILPFLTEAGRQEQARIKALASG